MFENEEFTTRTKKDHGIAIHPSLMSAADDEKKTGEVRLLKFIDIYVQYPNRYMYTHLSVQSYHYCLLLFLIGPNVAHIYHTMNPLVDYSVNCIERTGTFSGKNIEHDLRVIALVPVIKSHLDKQNPNNFYF